LWQKFEVLIGQRKPLAMAVRNNKTENRFSGVGDGGRMKHLKCADPSYVVDPPAGMGRMKLCVDHWQTSLFYDGISVIGWNDPKFRKKFKGRLQAAEGWLGGGSASRQQSNGESL